MMTETALAFAHPEDRSRAYAPNRDRIAVRDLVLETEIGAFQAERGMTQRIKFDVVVEISPLPADLSDDVDRILSYDRITEAIEGALSEERFNLLETLAEHIAERLLRQPQAERVFVRITKLDRPPGTLGVEIVRSQQGAMRSVESDVPRPSILALGAEAVLSPNLPRWLDEMEDRPTIIIVGASPLQPPQSRAPLAQRRIDLLALEQQAWVLAGQDKRCVVVSSRTELEWGLRHGQISVWAPSKMILDAVECAGANPRKPSALIAWLATEMHAQEIISVGLSITEADVPVRHSQGLETL